MKNKIIVFPASIWQAGLIKYLKKIDYFVYSLDDSCEAIGHKFSDRRVDIKSNEINKLRNFVNSNNSKIISCSSDLGQKLINKIYYKKNNIFNKFKQREIQKKTDDNKQLLEDKVSIIQRVAGISSDVGAPFRQNNQISILNALKKGLT